MKNACSLILSLLLPLIVLAQPATIRGTVREADGGAVVPFASVAVPGTSVGTTASAEGAFELRGIPTGSTKLIASGVGFKPLTRNLNLKPGAAISIDFRLVSSAELGEVVISGTLQPVLRSESAVPIDVLTPTFFRKNPTPCLFEALQTVNGVRPQLNCNVCATGDIHINGLEGPYTMVLLDGMPIVSGLSTVYGLSGIPSALIERVEIVKGPASTLYGSEAVGGLINVITRDPARASVASVDAFSTSWGEHSIDVGGKVKHGGTTALVGLNGFFYNSPRDDNADGFTDVALAQRVSVFSKLAFSRPQNRVASLAGRYLYEDRWGGQMRWTPEFRGGDSLYGESIYTSRAEVIGTYQLPVAGAPVLLSTSFNTHHQNSVYGTTFYLARQTIGFGQLTVPRALGRHHVLFGAALRFTHYDDNTPATAAVGGANAPSQTWLPGVFVQDEVKPFAHDDRHTVLAGLRYDYNSIHGSILTPRLNWKFAPNLAHTWRLGLGNGYRVVNVFTEDHAALTGARRVEIQENLRPERSWNANLNYQRQIPVGGGGLAVLEASAFCTYFTNKIVPDYATDPNLIRYQNLRGHAVSRGVSLNADLTFGVPLKVLAGVTVMDVYQLAPDTEGHLRRQRQLFAERVSGTFTISYSFEKLGLMLDYTGNIYGPRPLPTLGPQDPRPVMAPTVSLQNLQATQKIGKTLEIYGGVKNLLNTLPRRDAIARSFDPFDKQVQFDAAGQAIVTPDNPHALTFDPTYVYAPNQGRRTFLGVRWRL
ncbi:MAG: TonB-dependent receptor plug domain-containing protein [Hymenobacteraceae bacterium]|nr:TonB-dependent receptor plug domain-containing protein [Hymenobacteraceae bacterium]